MFIERETFAEAYEHMLWKVYTEPEYISSPRDMKIKEITNMSIRIHNPLSNLFLNKERSVNLKYLSGEIYWYLMQNRRIDFIQDYSKFWKKLTDEDGNINSNYGHLIWGDPINNKINSQWEFAYNQLIKDKDTRQAIIHFNQPKHQAQETKDFPCTIYGIFHIRDNKLNFSINMRSSDCIFGTTYDIPIFTVFQQQMFRLLKQTYTDLEIGYFNYFSNSQHIYEKDFELVADMFIEDFNEASMPELDVDLIDKTGNINLPSFNNNSKFLIWLKNKS